MSAHGDRLGGSGHLPAFPLHERIGFVLQILSVFTRTAFRSVVAGVVVAGVAVAIVLGFGSWSTVATGMSAVNSSLPNDVGWNGPGSGAA